VTGEALSRRGFLAAVAAGVGSAALARGAFGQEADAQAADPSATPQQASAASNMVMSTAGYREVRRSPKPGGRPLLSKEQSDALEHQFRCACGCTQDVFTCRTTDFSCRISPAMHRDVLRLVEGGYSADEIIAAFVDGYGERVLMAPKREGFNWAGYLAPFAAVGTGAAVIAALIKRWQRPGTGPVSTPRLPVQATPEELERLEAAVRGDRP
jgi:cytochrome c-type biogenesis protein CcmH